MGNNVEMHTTQLQQRGVILLTTNEAARRMRLSPRTLERWRVTGCGPAFLKVGRLAYYTECELDAWLASRIRRSTSDKGVVA